MRIRLAFTYRALIAALAAVLLHWPFANYAWSRWPIVPSGVTPSGDPEFIGAPYGTVARFISQVTWRYAFGVPEAIVAALVAIGVYELLTRRFAAERWGETRCRACRRVLRGLTALECPSCGERL
jgi:hypothetical protein